MAVANRCEACAYLKQIKKTDGMLLSFCTSKNVPLSKLKHIPNIKRKCRTGNFKRKGKNDGKPNPAPKRVIRPVKPSEPAVPAGERFVEGKKVEVVRIREERRVQRKKPKRVVRKVSKKTRDTAGKTKKKVHKKKSKKK